MVSEEGEITASTSLGFDCKKYELSLIGTDGEKIEFQLKDDRIFYWMFERMFGAYVPKSMTEAWASSSFCTERRNMDGVF